MICWIDYLSCWLFRWWVDNNTDLLWLFCNTCSCLDWFGLVLGFGSYRGLGLELMLFSSWFVVG